MWVMRVKAIPILTCVLGTASKRLERGLEGLELEGESRRFKQKHC